MQALDVSLAPAPQRAVVVDTALPPPPADAPIAVPEPGDWDFAPAPENQPETPAQDGAANAPVPDPDYDPASQAELITLIDQVLGTPFVSGGDSPAGTDCWGLASWVSNVASGRRAFGTRLMSNILTSDANLQAIHPAMYVAGFMPSLHLNLADGYRRLGRFEEASQKHPRRCDGARVTSPS
jgi:hypothetical protein